MLTRIGRDDQLGRMFKKEPMCEVCGAEPATSFSYFKKDQSWKLCGDCTSETEAYYVPFKDFFDNPGETVDWLAHLSEKGWVDWTTFMAMMRRLRGATYRSVAKKPDLN